MSDRVISVITVAAVFISAITVVAMKRATNFSWPRSRAMVRAARWLAWRAGRRGAFLLFLTILDGAYGWALATASVLALGHGPDLFLPVHAWGWIWAATGAFCLSGVLMRRDWAQYWAAAVLKACWAALYADIWLVQHNPDAWVSVVVWASFSMTVMLIGGWPEYIAVAPARPPGTPDATGDDPSPPGQS